MLSKNILSKKIILFFLLILLLAGFLRLYKLGAQSFIADEYIGVNVSYGYHKTGQWKYWDFNKAVLSDRVYTRAQIYYWQVAQTFRFFEPSETSARLVSVFWGMIGVVLIFAVSLLVTKNIKIALLATFLAAVSLSSLMFDRKLRMYSMFAPVYFLFSYAIFYFLESKKFLDKQNIVSKISNLFGFNIAFLPLVLVFGMVSYLTHLLAVNIIPTVGVYLIIIGVLLYKKREPLKQNKYFWYIVSALVIILASLQTEVVKNAIGWIDPTAGNWGYFKKIMLDYSYAPLGFLFLLIGSVYLVRKFGKIGIWTVVSFWVPFLVAVLLWDRNTGYQYIYFIQPFKIIIIATGIFVTVDKATKSFFEEKKYTMSISIVIVLMTLINIPFFYSVDSFYADQKKWSYSNYREAYQYYLDHKVGKTSLITRKISHFNIKDSNSRVINYGDKDFGKRGKLMMGDVQNAQKKYDQIWFITTDNDFNLGPGVRKYIKENFELIETKFTNNNVRIWFWEREGILRLKDKNKKLRFGFITDAHCYLNDKDKYGVRKPNWRCTRPMKEFANNMNEKFKPDFVIENGDLVDGRDRLGDIGFIKAQNIFNQIRASKFHVLGNHEVDNFTKERWLTLTANENTYYYFDIEDYRMIVLDGNFVRDPNFGNKIVDMSPDTVHSYKGMINKEQLAWLDDLLDNSQNRKVLIFIHEPPLDQTVGKSSGEIFINAKELRTVFSKYKESVLAVFGGHIEELCNVDIEGIRYYTFQGFHKKNKSLKEEDQFNDSGSFYQIIVSESGIKIRMFFSEGRSEPYQSMQLNQDNVVCNNKTLFPQN